MTAAYTLSSSERDTEDYTFVAQDQRNEAAERGPSAGDARHRLAVSLNVDLPFRLRLTAITTAQSGLPYNITTGAKDVDGKPNIIRQPGVGRNSARGAAFWQANARLSKALQVHSVKFELLAEVFNLANRANWMATTANRIRRHTSSQPAPVIRVKFNSGSGWISDIPIRLVQ